MVRIIVALVLALAACTAASPGGNGNGEPSSGGEPSEAAESTGPGPSSGGTGTYTEGAASVTVSIGGQESSFTDGTCESVIGPLNVWELVSGTGMDVPPYIDVYVGDAAAAIHDGSYTAGILLVTIALGDETYALDELTITLENGLTRGSFEGTNANPQIPVSGSFACG